MTNVIKAFILILCGSLAFNQQAQAQKNIEVGLQAGAHVNNLLSSRNLFSPRLGIQAGAFLRLNTSKLFGLQTGVLYSQQSTSIANTTPDPNIIMHYLKIPLLANFTFNEKIRTGVGLETGFLAHEYGLGMSQAINRFSLGARLEIAWKPIKQLEVMLYATSDLNVATEVSWFEFANMPDPQSTYPYRNVLVGLGVTYSFIYNIRPN